MHPETAAKLGIDDGDIVTCRQTAAGTLYRCPALRRIPGMRPRHGRDRRPDSGHSGATAATRKASASIRSTCSPLVRRSRRRRRVRRRRRRTSAKTGGHAHIVTTEGSARQHGRGIAQAITLADCEPDAGTIGNAHAPRSR